MRSTLSILLVTLCFTLTLNTPDAYGGKQECVSGSGDATTGNFFSGSSKYNAGLIKTMMSAMTHSCFVTQKKDQWVNDFLKENGWENVGGLMTTKAGRGYVAYSKDKKVAVVVFRGTGVKGDITKLLRNAMTDAKMKRTTIAWLPSKSKRGSWKGLSESKLKSWSKLKVHSGFSKEYSGFASQVETRMQTVLGKKKPKHVYCIGFSLGAALATHCGAHLKMRFNITPQVVVGASPRVGSEKFQKAYDKLVPNLTRIMLKKDPVPQIPGNLTQKKFEHAGDLLPLFYSKKKLGKRMTKADVKSRAHSWKNLVGDAAKFIIYHNYLKYKESLKKHMDLYCPDQCKGNTLKDLANAERKDSSALMEAVGKAAKKVKDTAKKVKNKTKKAAKKVKDTAKKVVDKAKCRTACNKKKKRKDRRNCKKKCK